MKPATIGYTIREAAKKQHVSTRTVRRHIDRKEIKAILKGNTLIIPPSEIRKIKTKPSGRPKKSGTNL